MTAFTTTLRFILIFLILLLIQKNGYSVTVGMRINMLQDTVPTQPASAKQPVYTTSRLTTSKPVIDGNLMMNAGKQE